MAENLVMEGTFASLCYCFDILTTVFINIYIFDNKNTL